jgi:hypothetical protein
MYYFQGLARQTTAPNSPMAVFKDDNPMIILFDKNRVPLKQRATAMQMSERMLRSEMVNNQRFPYPNDDAMYKEGLRAIYQFQAGEFAENGGLIVPNNP